VLAFRRLLKYDFLGRAPLHITSLCSQLLTLVENVIEEVDSARKMGPFFKDDPHPEKSGLFLHFNTNKKSITLNLKNEWGKRVLRELVKGS
jgi:hypothetical protein